MNTFVKPKQTTQPGKDLAVLEQRQAKTRALKQELLSVRTRLFSL
jgi:hypothetical protein